MTRRALIWCGYVDPYQPRDFPGALADVRLSVQAAVARGVAPSDIWLFLCDRDLVPEEFAGSHFKAATADLRRVAEEIASISTDEDVLLFVGANHGKTDVGLVAHVAATLDPYADEPEVEHLSPQVLEACLAGIRGTQVLIIGTCAAGVFLPLGNKARRVVYAACSADEKTHRTHDEPPRAVFLETMLGQWAGIAHGADPPPERVTLGRAFDAACQRQGWPKAAGTPLTRGAACWPD